MKSPAALKRAVLLVGIFLLIAPLQGCLWTALLFGPSNSVRDADMARLNPKAKNAIIVVAIRSEVKPLSRWAVVTLSHFKPAINSAGDCGTYDRAETRLAPETPGTVYAAFEVPPGTWVFNYLNDTSEDTHPHSYKGTFPAFIAPAGKATYIGEFVLTSHSNHEGSFFERGTFRLERDLAAAKAALGPAADLLELAETAPDPDYRPIFCTL